MGAGACPPAFKKGSLRYDKVDGVGHGTMRRLPELYVRVRAAHAGGTGRTLHRCSLHWRDGAGLQSHHLPRVQRPAMRPRLSGRRVAAPQGRRRAAQVSPVYRLWALSGGLCGRGSLLGPGDEQAQHLHTLWHLRQVLPTWRSGHERAATDGRPNGLDLAVAFSHLDQLRTGCSSAYRCPS